MSKDKIEDGERKMKQFRYGETMKRIRWLLIFQKLRVL